MSVLMLAIYFRSKGVINRQKEYFSPNNSLIIPVFDNNLDSVKTFLRAKIGGFGMFYFVSG